MNMLSNTVFTYPDGHEPEQLREAIEEVTSGLSVRFPRGIYGIGELSVGGAEYPLSHDSGDKVSFASASIVGIISKEDTPPPVERRRKVFEGVDPDGGDLEVRRLPGLIIDPEAGEDFYKPTAVGGITLSPGEPDESGAVVYRPTSITAGLPNHVAVQSAEAMRLAPMPPELTAIYVDMNKLHEDMVEGGVDMEGLQPLQIPTYVAEIESASVVKVPAMTGERDGVLEGVCFGDVGNFTFGDRVVAAPGVELGPNGKLPDNLTEAQLLVTAQVVGRFVGLLDQGHRTTGEDPETGYTLPLAVLAERQAAQLPQSANKGVVSSLLGKILPGR
jgi:hypothetical protein